MAEEQVWKIAKWATTFETASSRKLKSLHWVSIPANLTTNGYQLLLDEFGDDAPAIYGAWCALVVVASQCNVRGVLASASGKPMKLNHVARITGFPEQVFRRLFDWASSDAVKWLVSSTYAEPEEMEEHASAESPDNPPAARQIPPTTCQQSATSAAKSPAYPTLPYQTGQDITPPPTPTPSGKPAAVAGGGGLSFDLVGAKRGAERIRKKFPRDQLPTELCFQASLAATALEPGFVATLLADCQGKNITSPRHYVLKACQNMASRHGWSWDALVLEMAKAVQGAVA